MAGFDFPAFPPVGTLVPGGNNAVYLWEGTKWIPAMQPVPPTVGGPFLPIPGGALTGPLTLYADPTVPLGAATKQYVDTNALYTATGGTAPRHLTDHIGDQISIKDFGAKGDGVTNDTAAFTAAVATPSGTTIFIPANTTCIITPQAWNIGSKQINFVGACQQTSTIKLAPGSTVSSTLFSWNGATSPTVRNLTFDYSAAVYSGTTGLSVFSFTSCANLSVQDVSILNVPNNAYAIGLAACTNIRITYCYAVASTPLSTATCKAIAIFASPGPTIGGAVAGNTFVGLNTIFNHSTRILITGNDISGWGVGAAIATGTDTDTWGCVISDNRCHDSLAAVDMFGDACPGIEHWGTKCVLSGNACWNNAGAGIFNGGKNNLVTGNFCWDNNTTLSATGGGIAGGYTGATNNAGGSTYTANKCWDSGAGRQYYGFVSNSSNCPPQAVLGNDFSGVTGDVLLSAFAVTAQNTRSVAPSVAAAGGNHNNATQLTHEYTVVTSATAGTANGVRLPSAAGAMCVVVNRSGIAINVYPPGGGTIDGGTTDVAVSLASGAVGRYVSVTSTAAFTI